MEFGLDSSDEDRYGSLPDRGAPDVQVIVKVAHEELRRLIQQRTEIMKRIGTPREVCEQIQQRTMLGLPCSKNLVASVTTVLSRLVRYGEARAVPRDNGSRAWLWVSGAGDGSPHSMDSAEDSN